MTAIIDTLPLWLPGVLIMGLNIPALVVIILCYVWFGLVESAAVAAVAITALERGEQVRAQRRRHAHAVVRDVQHEARGWGARRQRDRDVVCLRVRQRVADEVAEHARGRQLVERGVGVVGEVEGDGERRA